MGINSSIFSDKNAKIIEPIKPSEPPKLKTPEQIEAQKEANKKYEEQQKKFRDMTSWVIDKIDMIVSKKPKEFKVELPISSIRVKNYPDNIPVYTYLYFSSVKFRENDDTYYKMSFQIYGDDSPDSKQLFALCHWKNTIFLDEGLINIPHIIQNKNKNLTINYFLREIFHKIENLYIDTYEECFTNNIVNNFLFENTENITFVSDNLCKKCESKTKNKNFCYFCINVHKILME
jgi:hypothetical protein